MVWPFSSNKTQGLDALRDSGHNYATKKINRLDEKIKHVQKQIVNVDGDLEYFLHRIQPLDQIIRQYNSYQSELVDELKRVHAQIKEKEAREFSHAKTVTLNRKTLQLDEDVSRIEGNVKYVGKNLVRLPSEESKKRVNQILSDADRIHSEMMQILSQINPKLSTVKAIKLEGPQYEEVRQRLAQKYPLKDEYDQNVLDEFNKISVKLSKFRDELEDLSKKLIALQAKRNGIASRVQQRQSIAS